MPTGTLAGCPGTWCHAHHTVAMWPGRPWPGLLSSRTSTEDAQGSGWPGRQSQDAPDDQEACVLALTVGQDGGRPSAVDL